MFRRIVSAVALAGLASGLLLTAIQHLAIAPMIRDAEVREVQAERAATPAKRASAQPEEGHEHEAWKPADARERLLATAGANIVIAIGFALLLAAAMTLRGASGWRAGLAYGVAGYAVTFVAPSLGLPPELPGTEAAALDARQLWWGATVVASAAGLTMAMVCRAPWLRLVGIALVIAPHAVGAPQSAAHATIHPAAAAQAFVIAASVANAVLWLSLGVGVGYLLWRRSFAVSSD